MERRKPQTGKQLLLRFAEGSDLRDRLEEVAKANGRSTTAEALLRLEASFKEGAGQSACLDHVSELKTLREQIRVLESRLPADLIDRVNQMDALMQQLDGKVIVTVDRAE